MPPGLVAAGGAGPADVEQERRLLPWARASLVGLAVVLGAFSLAFAELARDVFEPILDLIDEVDPSQAQIDAAVEEAQRRQADWWWVNLVAFLPPVCLAGLAVWANRVAHVARRLGYPARRSPGWAAAGWFVPVVNLWFPYQSIVDSLSPASPARGRVLGWWLVYVLGGLSALPLLVVGAASDQSLAPWAVPPAVAALVQAVLGLRVIDLVHADHAAAAARQA